jgi:predicted GNAT superfamily acetyltransferase
MSFSAVPHQVQIRHCSSVKEFEACVRVQQGVWGDELAVPATMVIAIHHAGGQVLGAFDGEELVGCTVAFVGTRHFPARSGSAQRVETRYLHSHIAAVLPECRDHGIGRSLKLFQRQEALKRGIDLIEWTFDPLELKNAYFNLARLGAVARRFMPNCYGITASALHAGIPTDRLVVEWWLASDRVKSILADDRMPSKSRIARIPLPAAISELKSADCDNALRVQSEIREQFQKRFAQGYAVTAVEKLGATVDYLLEPADAIAGLRLPPLERETGAK